MPPKKTKSSSNTKRATKTKTRKAPTRSVDPQSAQINFRTYMFQVLEHVPPVVAESLQQIYEDAVSYCQSEQKDLNTRFRVFQQLLGEVDKWTDEEIDDETSRFHDQVPWMREALRHMLVAQVHILLSVRHDRLVTNPQFMFEMPSEEEIVYHVMRKCAKSIKPQVRLFDHMVEDEVIETNAMEIEEIVRRSVERAINTLVPIEEIVNQQYGEKGRKKPKDNGESSSSVNKEDEDDNAEEEEPGEAPPTDDEIKALELDNERQQKEYEDKEARRKLETTPQETDTRVRLVEGEEHVDDTMQPPPQEDEISSLMARLEEMDRKNPERKAIKDRLKRLLAAS